MAADVLTSQYTLVLTPHACRVEVKRPRYEEEGQNGY